MPTLCRRSLIASAALMAFSALPSLAQASATVVGIDRAEGNLLPADKLKKGFACFLILVALKMIWGLL